MKSYTDIEQSRKLADILPIESADMCLNISQRTNMPPLMTPYGKFKEFFNMGKTPDFLIPCWSLVALLNVLPISIDEGQHCLSLINSNPNDIEWLCCYEDYKGDLMMECYADNQVDACYNMVLKLKEKDLL